VYVPSSTIVPFVKLPYHDSFMAVVFNPVNEWIVVSFCLIFRL